MSTGLVLGKFAPLHRGHQLLLDAAAAENDEVVVVIYDAPDVTSVPLSVRARWIASLYPTAQLVEAWDGPQQTGDTPAVKAMHERYLLDVLGGRRIDAFYSSEFYGHHVSEALGALDRRIDPDRVRVPISGTQIRARPYANRRFLEPVVYRDLVARVVFLGAPSTGKTTLARVLAEESGTVWMPEYGREYWHRHQRNRRLTPEQLVDIAEGHRAREDALLLEADTTLFVDTDATTTYVFSLDYHGDAHPRLAELAADTRNRYDLFFLCDTDVPYEDTWDRSGDVHRRVFQRRIEADLIDRRIPYITLRGTLDERTRAVRGVLSGFDRFVPRGDHLLRAAPQ